MNPQSQEAFFELVGDILDLAPGSVSRGEEIFAPLPVIDEPVADDLLPASPILTPELPALQPVEETQGLIWDIHDAQLIHLNDADFYLGDG